jgi:hypothetical protein
MDSVLTSCLAGVDRLVDRSSLARRAVDGVIRRTIGRSAAGTSCVPPGAIVCTQCPGAVCCFWPWQTKWFYVLDAQVHGGDPCGQLLIVGHSCCD